MSSTYTTAAGTVSFLATAESWSEPAKTEVNVIGFPGGDAVAISISGQRETTRTFKVVLSSATAYRSLSNMRAKAGTLLVENWDTSPVNAVLQQIQPDPIQADGQVYAQVQFVLY